MSRDFDIKVHVHEVAERIANDDCAYQVLMAFVGDNGNVQLLNKTAVAEMINLSKPTVFATVNALYCTGYVNETRVGRSKIYTLSDLGITVVEYFKQKARELNN
ncbi:MarR family transcriptional regulator (plasmid) [Bacillus sp. JAS24-2]|uniref:MarR family transcriptional regulator n=1 Tax=Bacillus sp. JAS24-2 TaxID=2217832 RepID=UPI0011EBFF1F|nr:MarR family transcriptional regulator [Bacillus sp. JAS24-2]QEL82781.1 MarR family transcriptional regulator [Bacillus sp. JAS24-2]